MARILTCVRSASATRRSADADRPRHHWLAAVRRCPTQQAAHRHGPRRRRLPHGARLWSGLAVNQFRNVDLERMKRLMRRPILLDLRNVYEPERVKALGFEYQGVGRG
jgi:hypothetical protein